MRVVREATPRHDVAEELDAGHGGKEEFRQVGRDEEPVGPVVNGTFCLGKECACGVGVVFDKRGGCGEESAEGGEKGGVGVWKHVGGGKEGLVERCGRGGGGGGG